MAEGASSYHGYLMREMGMVRNAPLRQGDDVRASILRHKEEAEKNPEFVVGVYDKTQPVPIFQVCWDGWMVFGFCFFGGVHL
jgi:hypothetical protein